jgi:hypothetical protein
MAWIQRAASEFGLGTMPTAGGGVDQRAGLGGFRFNLEVLFFSLYFSSYWISARFK